ncbi:unnamed protein product [Rotaria sp. Silwood2]|nr:unnamed protein product [Rotaria sp. Silwood2]
MNIQFSGTRSWPKRIIYDRLKDFFGGRAIIRYYYNIIFYVLMLCLFSFVMLVDYFPYNNNRGKRSGYSIGIPIPEIILHMCIWGLIIEEAVEIYGQVDLVDYRQDSESIITHNVYILLNDSRKLDANVTDLIVFNVDNRVINDGIVDKILINFCTAPTDSNAKIKLYIIKPVSSGSEHFSVQEQIESFVTNLRPSVGIQKFEIEPFRVHYGDYVGFKFTENAGCPFSIECASYYVEHIIDQNIEREVMHFTPSPKHGITVTFTLNHKKSKNKYFIRSDLEMNKMNNEEIKITTTSTDRNFSIPFDDNKPLITDKRRRISIDVSFRQDLSNGMPFQQRDNMLRESTIAQDYWQSLINKIMKEERDDSNREKKARFKHEHDSVELQKQKNKLIELLENTIDKNQHISPTNSLNSSYENYPMS